MWGVLDVNCLKGLVVAWSDPREGLCSWGVGPVKEARIFGKGVELCAEPEQERELSPGIHWTFLPTFRYTCIQEWERSLNYIGSNLNHNEPCCVGLIIFMVTKCMIVLWFPAYSLVFSIIVFPRWSIFDLVSNLLCPYAILKTMYQASFNNLLLLCFHKWIILASSHKFVENSLLKYSVINSVNKINQVI